MTDDILLSIKQISCIMHNPFGDLYWGPPGREDGEPTYKSPQWAMDCNDIFIYTFVRSHIGPNFVCQAQRTPTYLAGYLGRGPANPNLGKVRARRVPSVVTKGNRRPLASDGDYKR